MPALSEKVESVLKGSGDIGALSPIVMAEMESGALKVVELVEMLGPWLTDSEKEKRKEGTRLLTEVLCRLPPSLLSEQEVQLLTAFFCDRLSDHYTITPYTLTGLAALTLMANLADSAPMEIMQALQQNVTSQALTVSHRYTFYSILHNIYVKKKKKVLSDFPSDFLFGLISGMDSESDPRNLLYLFSFVPSILSEIPLKHLAEDAFSVFECYFPVDYNPVEEKDNITREDLSKGLEVCLASSAEFADYCLLMICEKLDSSLKVAQLDSLSLLIRGIDRWGIEKVSKHVKSLWSSLKNVLTPGTDPEVSHLALHSLTSLLALFSSAILGEEETKAFSCLLNGISSSTHGFLSDPSLSLFTPTLKMLASVAAVSSITADFIISSVLPQLVALLQSTKSSVNKGIVLKSLEPFLDSSIKFDSWHADECGQDLEKCLPLLVSLVEDSSCRSSSFNCLSTIVPVIPDEYRITLLKIIKDTVAIESSSSVREAYGKFVSAISTNFPYEVESQLLSAFKIPEEMDENQTERLLEMLGWVADAPPLSLPAARILLSYLSATSPYRSIAVTALRKYTRKCGERVLKVLGVECDYPLELIHSYLGENSSSKDGELPAVADVISSLVQTLESKEQERVLQSGLELLRPNITAPACPSSQLVLLEGLVSGLRPDVQLECSLELSASLLSFSISLDSEEARTSAAHIIALFINKSRNEGEVVKVLELGLIEIEKSHGSPGCVRLCAWITKALVLRAHPLAGSWLKKLLEYTSDPSLGMEGAEGVRLVLEESSLLSEANYCTLGLLYKQRVFEKVDLLIPPNSKPSKSASLAIAYILKNSPPALVIGRLDKLVSVLVHCVEEGDPVISTAVLQILAMFLSSGVSNVGPLAQTFIPRCLTLAKTSPYMVVRQEALECIYLFANFKPEDIMTYKKMVISESQKCLDDKKRLVRQSAVKARTRWFVV